jgi:hypothetical protein
MRLAFENLQFFAHLVTACISTAVNATQRQCTCCWLAKYVAAAAAAGVLTLIYCSYALIDLVDQA